MFATNSAGTKVWTVSYLPFGGVDATTGTPINLRFPGQWFQLEAGLNQNWMRDYDPTTGRYLQADPLGLVDGSSVVRGMRGRVRLGGVIRGGRNFCPVGVGANRLALLATMKYTHFRPSFGSLLAGYASRRKHRKSDTLRLQSRKTKHFGVAGCG